MIAAPDIIDGVDWKKNIPPVETSQEREVYNQIIQMVDIYWRYRIADPNLKREYIAGVMDEQKSMEINKTHRKLIEKMSPHIQNHFDPLIDFTKIDPVIELPRNDTQYDIWKYFRIIGSRVSYRQVIGKDIRLFLRDKTSDSILGILELSSPALTMGTRDSFYGFTQPLRKRFSDLIEYSPNMSTCVALYPFSEYTGGKLMTMLTSTPETFNIVKKVYGMYPFGVHTTSIYGKSIQYDRIREWDYLGNTLGHGSIHFSGIRIQSIVSFFQKRYPHKFNFCRLGMNYIMYIQKCLGLSKAKVSFYYHGVPRGIYAFKAINDISKAPEWIEGNYREIIEKKYEHENGSYYHFDTCENKFDFWKHRWFPQRYEKYHDQVKKDSINRYFPDYIQNRKRQVSLEDL